MQPLYQQYQLMTDGTGGDCESYGFLPVPQEECKAAALEIYNGSYDWYKWSNGKIVFDFYDWDYTPCGCFIWRMSDGTVKINYDLGRNGECVKGHNSVEALVVGITAVQV